MECNGKDKNESCIKIFSCNTIIYHCSNKSSEHDHCKNGYNLCFNCAKKLSIKKIVVNINNCNNSILNIDKSIEDSKNTTTTSDNDEIKSNDNSSSNNDIDHQPDKQNEEEQEEEDFDIDSDATLGIGRVFSSNMNNENSIFVNSAALESKTKITCPNTFEAE